MNRNLKTLLINIGLILVIIAISSLLVRHFPGTETLSEYAEKNPPANNRTADSTGAEDTDDTQIRPDVFSDDSADNNEKSDAADVNEESIPEESISEESTSEESIPEDRVTYQNGFYYQPLDDMVIDRITGCSYPVLEEGESIGIDYEDLSYVVIQYVGFDFETHQGEIICNNAIAQDLVEIFYELYKREYQLERVALIEEYDGDDYASCEANNTSCFNYRQVVGSSSLSKHALGLAIDINPLYNPYITYNGDGSAKVYPQNAADYMDRTEAFPHKIDENDLCYKLFTEHGFTWGGNWKNVKDYQHFQKN